MPVADLLVQGFCVRLFATGMKNDAPGAGSSRNLLQSGHELSRRPEATRCGVNDDTLDLPLSVQPAKCTMPYRMPEGGHNKDIRDKVFSWDA